MDLLVGAVRDRDAEVDVPADWIAMNPKHDVLRTLSGKTSIPVPVARIEALWLLKLQAGRDQDITDLFALFDQPCSRDEITEELKELSTPSLVKKLGITLQKIRSDKLYEDSMSRTLAKRGQASLNAWKRFGDFVESCIQRAKVHGPNSRG